MKKFLKGLFVLGMWTLAWGMTICALVEKNDKEVWNNGECVYCDGHYHAIDRSEVVDKGKGFYYICDGCDYVIITKNRVDK